MPQQVAVGWHVGEGVQRPGPHLRHLGVGGVPLHGRHQRVNDGLLHRQRRACRQAVHRAAHRARYLHIVGVLAHRRCQCSQCGAGGVQQIPAQRVVEGHAPQSARCAARHIPITGMCRQCRHHRQGGCPVVPRQQRAVRRHLRKERQRPTTFNRQPHVAAGMPLQRRHHGVHDGGPDVSQVGGGDGRLRQGLNGAAGPARHPHAVTVPLQRLHDGGQRGVLTQQQGPGGGVSGDVLQRLYCKTHHTPVVSVPLQHKRHGGRHAHVGHQRLAARLHGGDVLQHAAPLLGHGCVVWVPLQCRQRSVARAVAQQRRGVFHRQACQHAAGGARHLCILHVPLQRCHGGSGSTVVTHQQRGCGGIATDGCQCLQRRLHHRRAVGMQQ